jgi:protein-S-isoprenylcysteine O-methyltransferase Ste14
MVPIAIGMASILFYLISDWADGRNMRAVRIVVILLVGGGLVASAVWLVAYPKRFESALAVRAACWFGVAAFLFLSVVSQFGEISFRSPPRGKRRLVTTGTYALVRHPGVIWFFFFHSFLSLAIDSLTLLAALPFWTLANLAVAAVEDRVFFPRVFGTAYDEYRKVVPFLIPTRASLRTCIATFRLFPSGAGKARDS